MSSNSNNHLGRGLDALLPNAEPQQEVSIAKLAPTDNQPRRQFDDHALRTLADSIGRHGVLQPLIVTPADDDGTHVIIAGERRWRAAKLVGLAALPVVIRTATAQEHYELAIIENVVREDLNPLEEATAYRRLIDDFGLSQADVASRVGKARSSVANALRLLELPATIAAPVREGSITAGHALAILAQPSSQREGLLRAILHHGLSVRAAEQWQAGNRTVRDSNVKMVPGWVRDLEQRLGTKVEQSGSDTTGNISFHYHSTEQLNELLDKLK